MELHIHYHCSYLTALCLWDYPAVHQILSGTETVSSIPSLSKLTTALSIMAIWIRTRHLSCHRSMTSPDSYVCGILCSQAVTWHHRSGTVFVMACYWWPSSVIVSWRQLLSLVRAELFSISDSFDWPFKRVLDAVCELLNYAKLLLAARRGTSWWGLPDRS